MNFYEGCYLTKKVHLTYIHAYLLVTNYIVYILLYSSLRYYECSMYVFCFSIYPYLFLDDSAAILVIFTKMRTTMCKRCRQPLLCTKLFRSLRRSKCTRFAVIQYKPHAAFHPRFSSLHDKT